MTSHPVSFRKKWSPAEDLELRRYIEFGYYTSAEIAQKLQRTKSAVDARKNKLGITTTKISAKDPATLAQILKFRMAGWTQKRIGEMFGVTHSYISEILRINGFLQFCRVFTKGKHPRAWTEVELASLRKYLGRGYTTVQIQQELPHRSYDAISQKRALMTRHWLPRKEQERWERHHRRWANRTEFYVKDELTTDN